jgi:hypothetical protein
MRSTELHWDEVISFFASSHTQHGMYNIWDYMGGYSCDFRDNDDYEDILGTSPTVEGAKEICRLHHLSLTNKIQKLENEFDKAIAGAKIRLQEMDSSIEDSVKDKLKTRKSKEASAMKEFLFKLALSLIVTVAFYLFYRVGTHINGLMSVKTELYYTIHGWGAIILSPIVGATVFLKEW